MSHAVFVQKILHDFTASRFVGNAQSLVFDVWPQAIGVDLDGGLQKLKISSMNSVNKKVTSVSLIILLKSLCLRSYADNTAKL